GYISSSLDSEASGSFLSSIPPSVDSLGGINLVASRFLCQCRRTRSSDRAAFLKGVISLQDHVTSAIGIPRAQDPHATYHCLTLSLLIHFRRPLYLFSLIAIGGARSPRRANNSRVIPSAKFISKA